MTEIERRVAAAQATLDHFKDKPFRLGRVDCARMAAFHLRKLGHQVRLPASGSYGTLRTGLAELKKRGFESLAAALDSYGFERIPPAAATVGDIIMLPAVDQLGSLMVMLTNGRAVGFHEDAKGAAVLQPIQIDVAWRVHTR